MTLKDELSAIAGEAFAAEGLDAGLGAVKAADRPDLAQFQCNGALAAAKAAKKNPREIAGAVADRLSARPEFSEVTVAGPGFINLKLTPDFLAARIDALGADGRFGGWEKETPEKIVIDYGGPNVAKPLHVGHLRAGIIGESLKRIMRFAGDDVTGDVHLGDWGLQMGQLISELELRQPDLVYFDPQAEGPFPEEPPISLSDLEEMYPAASAACKDDPARADLARKATKALQAGRPGYVALWRHFVTLSVNAMKKDYADLEVEFDLWKGEADADPLIPELTEDLKKRGVLEESDGAEIIRVAREDDNKEMPPIIFLNSEGAVGYHATDIATIVDRKRALDPDRILYVVDARQRLHFEQVFRAVAKAGYFDEARLEHLWFGTMNGKDGKPFKTRAGGTLKLRDLIETVTDKARERLEENGFAEGYGEAETREVARQVGVAALKFADLSNPRTSDYIFDLDRFMAFEGKTGPYLLYASVRVRSVIAKAKTAGAGEAGPAMLAAPEEVDLALVLLGFADALRDAYAKRLPHLLCDHAFTLAQTFSKFYAACRIVDEGDAKLRASRLALASAVGGQLDLILSLLGFSAPERM
ncbi:arginine--tRNA ligase [Hyphococcus luteus]|uniref:Arginine--tRNA ligase n=1 Tax=Hyphococcus luteus TaxID=2058213 RepID=A0A2S7K4X2_9PROT|nr:arginine--tRNA ligase [Marinicaulis flavus]PQA87542.1 arginine--tRNA ligase [Marinicaulis flavus]